MKRHSLFWQHQSLREFILGVEMCLFLTSCLLSVDQKYLLQNPYIDPNFNFSCNVIDKNCSSPPLITSE